MSDDRDLFPLQVFNFEVDFKEDSLSEGGGTADVTLCSGSFFECTGLEATMEQKVIKEGGHNYGVVQRSGPVTFATVVLKRGMTTTRHLWRWFELVTSKGGYSYRLAAFIKMKNQKGEVMLTWKLEKAMPVKFKAADLNAKGTEVGVEELHLAHEGLTLV
jgi:phage tail-like protein